MTTLVPMSRDLRRVAVPDRPSGRYRFGDLLRSELTKLRTVRSTAWTLAATVALGIGLGALATLETRAHWSTMSTADRLSFDPTATSLVGVFFAQLTIGVLGILAVSAEYGTGTIRATFCAAPRRPAVLAAKAALFAAVSLVVSEVTAFAAYFIGQALLTAPATHSTISSSGALRAVAGSGLYLCVLGLFAMGIAVVVRHTAGAISTFAGTLLVLPVVSAALPQSLGNAVDRFLPARIGDSMISLQPGPHAFAPWPGFLLLCAYATATLAAGAVLLVRRDA